MNGADFTRAQMPVVMGCFYRREEADDRFRLELMLETLTRYRRINRLTDDAYPVVVADASPDQDWMRDTLAPYGVTRLDARSTPGIGPQNQAGIRYAYEAGAQYVLRQEPEKYGLAEEKLLRAIRMTIGASDAGDILCVGRLGKGFTSLPEYQQVTERQMSHALASLAAQDPFTGAYRYLPEDTASGIRAMTRTGMVRMTSFDTEKHGKQWEFLWYPLVDELADGRTLLEFFLPFIHPIEMQMKEEGLLEDTPEQGAAKKALYDGKRDMQRDLIVPKVTEYAATRGVFPHEGRTWEWERFLDA